jgi:hypothetical protein
MLIDELVDGGLILVAHLFELQSHSDAPIAPRNP